MPSVTPRMFLAAASAEQHQHLGGIELDLPGEEGRAGLDLFRRRRAVAGRAPIDGIGDVDIVLGKPDRLKHAVEQLPGAADEGLALQILVAAGRFADQHEARAVAAAREAEALRRALERAAFETCDQGFELGKTACSSRLRPRPALLSAAGAATLERRGGASGVGTPARGACGARRRAKQSTGASPIASSAPIAAYQSNKA